MSESPHRQWDGAAYDRVADPQTRWGAAVLERLELRGDETVIDCGCGSGRVTEKLLARLPVGRVIALDTSPSMLDQARNRLEWAGERVVFVRADARTLTPATLGGAAPVDAVFSNATFHLIADHPLLFRNLAGVIRAGGQLVAQCGAVGNITMLLAIARRFGVTSIGTREYATAEVTRRRLVEAGFADARVWTNDEPTRFDSVARLKDFVDTVCLREAVAGMGDDEREQLVSNVVDAMPEPVIDYMRLNIVAHRR